MYKQPQKVMIFYICITKNRPNERKVWSVFVLKCV